MNKKNPKREYQEILEWSGAFRLPDFNAFQDKDFAPAFEIAFQKTSSDMEKLSANQKKTDIENFLVPFELLTKTLDRVCAVFFLRANAHTTPQIQIFEQEVAPKLARFSSQLMMNKNLFSKIDFLYHQRNPVKQDSETRIVIERHWKAFVKNGAKLSLQEKQHLLEIDERLAILGTIFSQNVLKDEVEWVLYLKKEDLAGLDSGLCNSMHEIARERGHNNSYAITLSRAIIEPFLTFSGNQNLRKIVFDAWRNRGANGGKTDNCRIVLEIVALRDKKAKLLGFTSYRDLKLEDSMAKTPNQVLKLLSPIWEKAKLKARAEKAAFEQSQKESGINSEFLACDWRYYTEKHKRTRYAFDQTALKPYLQLENIIKAAFWVAGRLFGLQFEEQYNPNLWHPEARLWIVKYADGKHCGLFAADYFSRTSKKSGAWMSSLTDQHKLESEAYPIIYNITNFVKSEKNLLSIDDARTLFHEFGHALHGLLSNVTWPSVSGTSVLQDFVELPSQLYENWLMVPEVMRRFARHYETNEPIPDELIKKNLETQTINSGFETVEYLSSALMDMAFHSGDKIGNLQQFEKKELKRLNMPKTISMRHYPYHFTHIFSGDEYAASYYSYMWSEVLDADIFAMFIESGDVFNPGLVKKLLQLYSKGGSKDPSTLYKAFRENLPSPEAMMKRRGFI